jgi:hypothetical protein
MKINFKKKFTLTENGRPLSPRGRAYHVTWRTDNLIYGRFIANAYKAIIRPFFEGERRQILLTMNIFTRIKGLLDTRESSEHIGGLGTPGD